MPQLGSWRDIIPGQSLVFWVHRPTVKLLAHSGLVLPGTRAGIIIRERRPDRRTQAGALNSGWTVPGWVYRDLCLLLANIKTQWVERPGTRDGCEMIYMFDLLPKCVCIRIRDWWNWNRGFLLLYLCKINKYKIYVAQYPFPITNNPNCEDVYIWYLMMKSIGYKLHVTGVTRASHSSLGLNIITVKEESDAPTPVITLISQVSWGSEETVNWAPLKITFASEIQLSKLFRLGSCWCHYDARHLTSSWHRH